MKKLSENSPRKNRMILVAVTILVIIIIFTLGLILSPSGGSSIDSFQACADAGYPIQESYPERCAVPGGQTFTRTL